MRLLPMSARLGVAKIARGCLMDPLIAASTTNAVALITYLLVGVSLACLVVWLVAVVRLVRPPDSAWPRSCKSKRHRWVHRNVKIRSAISGSVSCAKSG